MSSKQSQPKVFAPRPISNVLKSKLKTPIIEYKSGKVIREDDDSQEVTFVSIDLDEWMRTTIGYIDELLTPKCVSRAEILRKNIKRVPIPPDYVSLAEILCKKQKPVTSPTPWGDALQEVLTAKEHLADKLRMVMIPVYEGETANAQQLDDIQKAFYKRMLGTMGQFYFVKAGIQFNSEVNVAIKQLSQAHEAPKVFGDIQMTPEMERPEVIAGDPPVEGENISVSSPKIHLKFDPDGKASDPSPCLNWLVSSTATDTKNGLLNLNYDGQYIEHEIGTLEGLSQLYVPIVLRSIPVTPTLVNQERISVPKAQQGNDNPLTGATRWVYAFNYSMQVHDQQDEIHGTVSFNIFDSSRIAESKDLTATAAPKRDLFDNLAQFVQVYPAVRDDLELNLANIDVCTTDRDRLVKAQTALESVAAMINWLADSFAPLDGENEKLPAASAAEGVASIEFTISEAGVPKGNVQDALKVTVKLTEDLPPRVGKPRVEIDGYTCELEEKKQPRTNTPCYIFFYKDSDSNYLSFSIAKNIQGRKFVLPDLEIVERQAAQTEIYLTRYNNLVPGKKIAKPFIYTTTKVSFANLLQPTLFNDDEINLAEIFAREIPVPRSLESNLNLFYQALFSNAGTDDVTLQSALYYEYSISPILGSIRLPVYLMSPTKTAIRAGGSGTSLKQVTTNQVNGWETWFNNNMPENESGKLIFDFTVMSDLTALKMPILKMTGLYLPFTDLTGCDNVTDIANN